MENLIKLDPESIELLTYNDLTTAQKNQVEKIAQALNNSSTNELIEVMQKHCYFFVDAENKEGEILDYTFR